MKTSFVPQTPTEATPEWFTHALRESQTIPTTTRVSAVESSPVGNGLIGVSVRFELTYEGADGSVAPQSVVCKFPTANPDLRAAAAGEHVYTRESTFYRELAQELDVRVPRCFYIAEGKSSDDFVLVLEDLGPAQTSDQIVGCDMSQAEAAIDSAAGVHAPFWGSPALDSASWNVRSMWIPQVAQAYPALFAQYSDAFRDKVSADDLAIGEAFAPVIGEWFAQQPRPWTITHGDFRLDNMLFGIRGGAEPIGVLDWQTILVGSGVVDVAYFIGTSLPTDVRREHEERLVRRYHAGLLQRGVKDYSFERCWNDYRYSALLGYFMATYAPMLVKRTERGDQMFAQWLQRVADQMRDLDSPALLPSK